MIEESIAQKITKAALREPKKDKKLAHLAEGDLSGTTESEFACEPVYHYIVSIEDKPVTKERFMRFDSDIKITKGMYSIQYIPLRSYKRNPKFPYLIGQDLVRLRVTVSGPRHWGCLCKRIPELGWVKRNSTLTDYMFSVAKKHPGLIIKFGINYEKYCKTIEERAEKEGIDIDHKPLFTYAWDNKTKSDIASVNISGWKKDKDYYQKELEEVEHSSTVLEEIKKGL